MLMLIATQRRGMFSEELYGKVRPGAVRKRPGVQLGSAPPAPSTMTLDRYGLLGSLRRRITSVYDRKAEDHNGDSLYARLLITRVRDKTQSIIHSFNTAYNTRCIIHVLNGRPIVGLV